MCGFVAFLAMGDDSAPTTTWMQALLDTIAHRGPDDQGIAIDGRIGLGFRRLSILDLSMAAHQPMNSSDATLSLVFNGEIYNYLELRTELESGGYRFRSSGDTEVLLAAYERWGTNCVDRLVGMFAFCVVDRRSSTLFVARDRFGIKPLYFATHARGILFTSELKAIRNSGLWDGALNTRRFAQFLTLGRTEAVPDDSETYLAGIQQVLPGHACVVRFDGVRTDIRYWDPTAVNTTRGDPVAAFLEMFDDAMRLHMRSDVPVGVMLSGGLDSVSAACAMARISAANGATQPLHAFCYVSEEFDESTQLQDTLRQTGAVMHQLDEMRPEAFWSSLHQLVWFHDEPVHSPSVLMGYGLYGLAAANGIRVVLAGQGADETLGGYDYFHDHRLVTEALHGRVRTVFQQAGIVARARGRSRSDVLQRCALLLRAHLLSHLPGYSIAAARRRMQEGHGRPFLSPDFAKLASPIPEYPPGQSLVDALGRATGRLPLPHYLRAEDRNSMAHSVEARVPFLDHRLVEQAIALPARRLLSDGWNKRILREAMTGRIPDSVRLRREKFGFPTSARRWFAGPLAERTRQLVADGPAMQTGWFDRGAVGRAFDRHVRGEADETNLLFNIAQLDSWFTWHATGWRRSHQSQTLTEPA